MNKQIAIATNNQHKIFEIRKYLNLLGIDLSSPKDLDIQFDVEETGTTFEENASIKSQELFKKSGIPSFADDSGICVLGLDGGPGIYSARFGNPQMNDKERAYHLLKKMEQTQNRLCYYYCAIAFTNSNGTYFFSGRCDGEITYDYDESGKYGFGYDPIFYYPPLQKRFSQVETNEKNLYSHRGIALRKFVDFLK
ncbi:MAG: RdgB/HAM1 family non-canonical purine NTP pyrophosphatase [Leptospiraceae bacterium]|nr:RdgB/HAM1 family non-canonical purine NTP pyrophosphatase [Leptospiraceae bacterium]MCP5495788.1 RdgB/HAM1 family non-canonical purine NTP pyrophosphatase [Leptospiraceae bacterium]